ncbi:MAG: cytochrome P450 [Mycobacteriaceae bacterium]|nr:cytochrome P450 [Mycobacteriaceae bacterium]
MSGAPTITDLPRIPLYSEEFAVDPHVVYARMRQSYGPLVPVELSPGIPATLVIGYWTAVRIAHDHEHFSADPRRWQQAVPPDCPVLPMLEYRPNALRSAGPAHTRFRRANLDSIDKIDLYRLHNDIEGIAVPLINAFCERGEADLISQYTFPVTFAVLNTMVGCPAEIGHQVAEGMAMMFEGKYAAEGSALFARALADLVSLRRAEPGDDLATRLVNHEAELTDEEMVHQLVTIYGAGIEPLQNLISNTLLLMLTDSRFSGTRAPTTNDALNELLFKDPPLANFGITYPRHPIMVDGVWLPADQPVVISMAACNNDPAIEGEYANNNSHLAWGVGPHVCPAKSVAYIVAQNAIDQLLDALPDIRLGAAADELTWRPGPFHRSLAALPVEFHPAQQLTVP